MQEFYKDLNLTAFYDDSNWINVNEDAIKFSILNIIMTNKGEHLTDPNFGVGIERYLFDNIGDDFFINLEKEIEFQLETYEPRIQLISVEFVPNEIDANKLTLYVYYKMKQTENTEKIEIILKRKI